VIPVRRIALSSLVLGVAVGLLGCGSRPVAADPSAVVAPVETAPVVGSKRVLGDTPFERSWDLNLKKPIAGSWVLPALPGTVFFQLAETHELVAVDALSGHTRWMTMALPEALRVDPALARVRVAGPRNDIQVFDERLYLISQDVLFCFDMASGQLIWRYELPFAPASSPSPVGVESGLRVFIGDWAGRMQVVTYDNLKSYPFIAWQYNLGSEMRAPAVEKEELVYVADGKGFIHAFKADRSLQWSFNAGGHVHGSVAIRDRALFAGTTDSILYAIDRLTGEKLGQVNVNAPITRAPFLYNHEKNMVYAWVGLDQGARGGLYGFHAQADSVTFADTARHPLEVVRMGQSWHLPGVDTLVGSTPGVLYVTTGSGTEVKAVNRLTGTVEWTWDVQEERTAEQLGRGVKKSDLVKVSKILSYQDPTDTNRSLFVIDESGTVVAYRFYGYVPEAVAPEGAASTLAPKQPAAAAPATAP
jgi:outer membrane protein assembly factor BamB